MATPAANLFDVFAAICSRLGASKATFISLVGQKASFSSEPPNIVGARPTGAVKLKPVPYHYNARLSGVVRVLQPRPALATPA